MKTRLRLGVIGTGLAAHLLYLPALKKLRHRIEIVACTNRTRHKAEHFAKLVGCPLVVDTPEELLDIDRVQAVLISLPIDVQPQYVKSALRAGKAVLSEKPVGPSVAAAKRLLKSTARYQLPWMVGENFHFMPQVRRLVQWVATGRLGDLRVLDAVQINKMDRRNPYFQTSWRRNPQFTGGFVADAGVHLAHVVRLVAGMPEHVVSHTAQFDPELPPMDSAIALMTFSSGLLGTWTSCFSGHYHGPMLRISGSRGAAELDWTKATLWDSRGKVTVFETAVDSFYAQFEHFTNVVCKGETPAVTPQEALLDLSLMEALIGA